MNRVERDSAAWGPHSIRTTILLLGRREGEREKGGRGRERKGSRLRWFSSRDRRDEAGRLPVVRIAGGWLGGGLVEV